MKTGVLEKRTQWNDILTTPCTKIRGHSQDDTPVNKTWLVAAVNLLYLGVDIMYTLTILTNLNLPFTVFTYVYLTLFLK